LLALAASAIAQPTSGSVLAGSPADTFHTPTQVCTFSGAVALNPPCVTVYTDPALGTLFYGYAGLPFSFAIPMSSNGTCDVLVTAYEPNKTATGQRKYTIQVGTQAQVVDLFALVGQKTLATITFPAVPITNNLLSISFQSLIGNPLVQRITWQNCKAPAQTLPITLAPDGSVVISASLYVKGAVFSDVNATNAAWACTGATSPTSDCTGTFYVQLALADGTTLKLIGTAPPDPSFTITPQWTPLLLPTPSAPALQ